MLVFDWLICFMYLFMLCITINILTYPQFLCSAYLSKILKIGWYIEVISINKVGYAILIVVLVVVVVVVIS